VYEAAKVLGITVDAIRKRVQRGAIRHERDDNGRV
jgi:excisionase family DNA binding protein